MENCIFNSDILENVEIRKLSMQKVYWVQNQTT